jgi:hypothetical protein
MTHMDQKKYNELLEKRKQYEEKLKKLYVGFHGVRHENAASELRYVQIKVTEDFLTSIDAELRAMKEKI